MVHKNVTQIANDILHNRIINKSTSIMMQYNQENICAYMDSNINTLKDIIGKYVVYYMMIGDYHYIGSCNVLSRRIQEHLRRDNRLYKYIKQNKEIYYKPLAIFNNYNEARNYEKNLICSCQYLMIDNLLNINL
jgi:hypothetical protein